MFDWELLKSKSVALPVGTSKALHPEVPNSTILQCYKIKIKYCLIFHELRWKNNLWKRRRRNARSAKLNPDYERRRSIKFWHAKCTVRKHVERPVYLTDDFECHKTEHKIFLVSKIHDSERNAWVMRSWQDKNWAFSSASNALLKSPFSARTSD